MGARWDEIRDFLAIHYRFNKRLDTPFWQSARNDTKLHGAESIVKFFVENGPSLLGEKILLSENNQFGIEGYLAMFVGMNVEHQKMHEPCDEELSRLTAHRSNNARSAGSGVSVKEALKMIRDPRWRWS
jgi:tryptophan halogenase